ncbi:MAG: glycerol dehydratase reactivase beta/small subunit family protein [Lachnospiraceae bacterium]|nr:glycerol dehydratase reactivase beta/small subunit family protein [Lachnospiraceae bacterium]MDY5742147.1 glycerol dehydratase reactivase beta/small subunit family protein [Lachnospiraceae bacterium]
MIINKPTVKIYIVSIYDDLLKEICAGIEEEGVLYEVVHQTDARVSELAYQAAHDSIVAVGIGIVHREVAMHLEQCAKGTDAFCLLSPTADQCRRLGANAARAVKRKPFKSI